MRCLVFGLRGNVFRSDDGGKHWTKVDSQLAATIVSGVRTKKGALLLADQGGRIVASTDGGKTVQPARSSPSHRRSPRSTDGRRRQARL